MDSAGIVVLGRIAGPAHIAGFRANPGRQRDRGPDMDHGSDMDRGPDAERRRDQNQGFDVSPKCENGKVGQSGNGPPHEEHGKLICRAGLWGPRMTRLGGWPWLHTCAAGWHALSSSDFGNTASGLPSRRSFLSCAAWAEAWAGAQHGLKKISAAARSVARVAPRPGAWLAQWATSWLPAEASRVSTLCWAAVSAQRRVWPVSGRCLAGMLPAGCLRCLAGAAATDRGRAVARPPDRGSRALGRVCAENPPDCLATGPAASLI